MLNVRVSRLQPQGLVKSALRLVCREEGDFHEAVELFVEGTPIGGKLVTGRLTANQTVDVPIDRFPLVSLPTAIRLKAPEGVFDPDAEVGVETADQVALAIGKGEVVLDGYLVEGGAILITLSNVINGFWTPNVFARFDTGATRTAVIDSVRRREEGGCQARLRLPLYVGDFHQAGLSLEIFCADRDGPLGQIEYRRVDPESQVSQVARVAAELRSLHAAQTMRIAAMESDFKHALAAMEARLESFCEYVLSLTHDRLAATAGQDRLDETGVAAEAKLLLAEIGEPGEDARHGETVAAGAKRVFAPIDSDAFGDGWNFPESDADGQPFRWMERAGHIALPCPACALSCVIVDVGTIFTGEPPAFSARIDGLPANVQCFAMASGFQLKITPPPPPDGAAQPEPCALVLESAVWGTPFDRGLGSDRRELSALVRSVEVFIDESA